MHRSDRQLLTGVVVNDKPNVRREDFDRLKATLTNCVEEARVKEPRRLTQLPRTSYGPDRVRGVAQHERGKKLQDIFRCIEWAA